MDELKDMVVWLAIFPPVALLVVAALVWRGCFRRNVFDDAPTREAGLSAFDLAGGLAAMMIGGLAFQILMQSRGLVGANGKVAFDSILEGSVWGLVGQVMAVVPLLLYIIFRIRGEENGAKEFGFIPRDIKREISVAAVATIVSLVLVFATSTIVVSIGILFEQPAPKLGHQMLEQLVESPSTLAQVLIAVSAIVVAPIVEEIAYRGLIQTALLTWLLPAFGVFKEGCPECGYDLRGTLAAGRESCPECGKPVRLKAPKLLTAMLTARCVTIFFAALLFAMVHIGGATWQTVPSLFVLGVILGWVYERTGSLLPCILIHAIFNGVNIAIVTLWPSAFS